MKTVRGKTIELEVGCSHCKGRGIRRVTGVYLRTYQLVEANPLKNGAELAKLDGCSPEAMCNRLKAMANLGIVGYLEDGRQKLWSTAVRNANG